jgi:hypothetical protein
MITIENTEVFGWEAATRGMRNPLNSWEKSDSYWTHIEDAETLETAPFQFFVGENDLSLMKRLSKAGNDHGKFLRMINVTVDLTAPLYWWKEFDTYKVGTVANSCSTMHKIHAKEFTLDDFSHDQLDNEEVVWTDSDIGMYNALDILGVTIDVLNRCRERYLKTKDKEYWWQMIQLLPSSYNQRRTVQLNYQVLKSMYFARRNHKLDEWHTLCDWMLTLPYFKEICVDVYE